MVEKAAKPAPRWLQISLVLLAAVVLLDVALFGWLIFRSLSQREIERTLLETRLDAQELARQIAERAEREGSDLATAVTTVREIQTYLDSALAERQVIQTVEIRDQEGRLVFRNVSEATLPRDQPEAGGLLRPRERQPRIERQTVESRETFELGDPAYDLEVPIAELGFLRIGISRQELETRIGVLRQELMGKTLLVALLTVVVLGLTYLLIWWLWRRGRRLEEQAAESERMAYLGTLASGLAHEIRNPLNSLRLNLQLMEEEGDGAAGGGSSRLLVLAREEIGRLQHLVEDFLRYARPRPLELERVGAAALLERCREVLASEAEARGVLLSVEDLSGGAVVEVDPGQMIQLLINLTQNALIAAEDAERPRVWLRAHPLMAGRLTLEVEDNGSGIPESERDQIFDLFYSSRRGGTGLGLAIVERIAAAHGGRVELDSAPGAGTRFRLLLNPGSGSSGAS